MPTGALDQVIRKAVDDRPPPFHRVAAVCLYATQASTPNPTIVLFVNDPDLLHFSYQRYLENRIRSAFGFSGVRLRLVARRRAVTE